MVKLLSAISLVTGIFLVASCTKTQNYGGTAVEKVSNGWWAVAYSSQNGPITPASAAATGTNHIFFVTYNTSADSPNEVWADDLGYIGGAYDVKSVLGVNLANYTLSSGSTANLYQPTSSVQWASGKIFPKGGLSRTGVVTDSIFVQFLFTGSPGDTLTIEGVARTGFDGDDWPADPFTPTP